MPIEKTLPISWDGWDEAGDVGDIMFYKVIFLEDFGPIKRGDKFNSIVFLLKDALIECYNDEGDKVIHTIKIKIIPDL